MQCDAGDVSICNDRSAQAYSSARDMAALMARLFATARRGGAAGGVVGARSVRDMYRPAFVFGGGDFGVAMPWEMRRLESGGWAGHVT